MVELRGDPENRSWKHSVFKNQEEDIPEIGSLSDQEFLGYSNPWNHILRRGQVIRGLVTGEVA